MNTHNVNQRKSYINFSIGEENFAIIVNRVLEILNHEQLTHVPNASDYIKGILNFRGAIVPIINLPKRFNFVQHESESKMVIVVEIVHQDNHVQTGLLVDEVTDVIGIKYNPDFLEGFIEGQGKFIMVLDVDRVLSVSELAEIREERNNQLSA
jgi:purine-binding chemotaxis protein CheW